MILFLSDYPNSFATNFKVFWSQWEKFCLPIDYFNKSYNKPWRGFDFTRKENIVSIMAVSGYVRDDKLYLKGRDIKVWGALLMINLQHICATWWEFCLIVDLSSMIKEAGDRLKLQNRSHNHWNIFPVKELFFIYTKLYYITSIYIS